MNKLIKHFNKQIKTLNIYDLKLLGWACIMLGLLLATAFPILIKVHTVFYFCAVVLFAFKPYRKLLKK